jgi:hypothetical protein
VWEPPPQLCIVLSWGRFSTVVGFVSMQFTARTCPGSAGEASACSIKRADMLYHSHTLQVTTRTCQTVWTAGVSFARRTTTSLCSMERGLPLRTQRPDPLRQESRSALPFSRSRPMQPLVCTLCRIGWLFNGQRIFMQRLVSIGSSLDTPVPT